MKAGALWSQSFRITKETRDRSLMTDLTVSTGEPVTDCTVGFELQQMTLKTGAEQTLPGPLRQITASRRPGWSFRHDLPKSVACTPC